MTSVRVVGQHDLRVGRLPVSGEAWKLMNGWTPSRLRLASAQQTHDLNFLDYSHGAGLAAS